MNPVNVLVTSVGRRSQLILWLKQVQAGGGAVFAVDTSPSAPALYLADDHAHVPRVDTQDYLSALLSLCQQWQVKLVVPTIDTELSVLARARQDFEAHGITVLVSRPETIALAGNKRASSEWLAAHGFPVPQQWAIPDAQSMASLPPFPLFAKPVHGSRSQGARIVAQQSDLDRLDGPLDYVLEEWVQGVEYTVSTYVDRHGRCVAAVPRERVEVRDGEVVKAVTRQEPAIEDLAARVVEALPGAWGPLNVQIIKDPSTGRLWVIEVNARFGGGDPLAWQAGADMPSWAITEACGGDAPVEVVWSPDLAMLRYEEAVYLPWQHS